MNDFARGSSGQPAFLAEGGEMARRIREHDWAATPLGPIESWPQNLRTVVGVMLHSPGPVSVLWGPESIQLYNDAYIAIAAERHPASLGRPAVENWDDAYESFLGPILSRVLMGEAVTIKDQLVSVRSSDGEGTAERCFTASFSPIRDEAGVVAGIFHPVTETTDRILAELRLREGETRLRGVLEGMDEAFGLLDRDFRILTFNEAALRLETRPLEEIVGRSHWDVYPGSEDDEIGRLYKRALAEQSPVALEHRYTWQDGTTRWLEMRAYPVPEGLAVFWRDISGRKEAEEALRESEERQGFLLKVSDALRPLEDPVEVQTVALRLLGQRLGANRVAYAEDAGDGETVILTRNYVDGAPSIEGRFRYADYGEDLIREMQAGRTVVRSDVANDPLLSEAEKAAHGVFQLGATLNVPLVKGTRLVAILAVHFVAAHAFTPKEVALVQEVAERTWDAVQRARAERERRTFAERNVEILESISDGFYAVDRDWRFTYLNSKTEEWWGRKREDLLGKVYWEEFPRAIGSVPYDAHLRAMATREVVRLETMSAIFGQWIDISINPTADGGLSVYFRDISDRKRAEAELRESQERFRAIVETATDYAIFTTDAEGGIETWPAGAQEVFGWSADEAVGQSDSLIFTPEDQAQGLPQQERQTARDIGQSPNVRWHVRRDGSRVFIEGVTRPLRGEDGAVTGFVKVGQDVTERRATEEALRRSEERYRTLFNTVEAGFCVLEVIFDERRRPVDYRFLEANPAFGRHTGLVDAVGRTARELVPELERHWFDVYGRVALTGEPMRIENGSEPMGRWFEVHAQRVDEPEARRVALLFSDITERRQAQKQLEELNETLEQRVAERTRELDRVWHNSQDLQVVVDGEGVFKAVSPAATRLLGWLPEEMVGRPLFEFTHPDGHADSGDKLAEAAATPTSAHLNRYRDTAGGYHWISWITTPADGLIYCYGRDVTAEVQRQAELEAAQEQLRQSQKMDAMGQLTGGVAHDFNNLLTPIVGSLDMLTRRGIGGERERRLMDGALQSAERAKTLVQRLLAFARRQPLQPGPVEVRRLVGGMAELVASTLGPRIDVRVDMPEDLPPALADANQLEMAVLNLAVNARDAMPEGGALTISGSRESVRPGHPSKLRPGHYVRLSVKDTGVGMDEETLARAVEPFFSTKGVGRGTGLGLSMVHGLASQLNGGLTIASRPGEGATVDLWLPISSVAVEEDDQAHGAATAPKAQGTALLVDDEDLVRLSTGDMLMDLGYEVVEESSAEEALRRVDQGLRPDLVVTDHLMPGMSGLDLARDLRSRQPDLPVLIVSGYAEMEGIAPGFPRLTKPFRAAELAASLAALMQNGKE